jgi:hypothetical protein
MQQSSQLRNPKSDDMLSRREVAKNDYSATDHCDKHNVTVVFLWRAYYGINIVFP